MQFDFPQLSMPEFPIKNFSIFLNGHILFAILVVFFIFYSIISAVLFYHWTAYGMRHYGVLVAETLFSIVSLTLFCMAGLALYYF